MSQNVPESVMATLKKLANMSVERGCTPAEAGAAAAHLERLLEQYQLTMFDVATQKYDEEVIHTTVDVGSRLPKWTYELARAVAKPHDCDYFSGYRTDPTLGQRRVMAFVGHKSDVTVTQYLFETLSRLLFAMAERDGYSLGRSGPSLTSFRCNFMVAASREVGRRLTEERRSVRAETQLPVVTGENGIPQQHLPSTSTALVVVKDKAVKDYMKRFSVRRTTSQATNYDALAHEMGRQAGQTVELKRGIAGGQRKQLTS